MAKTTFTKEDVAGAIIEFAAVLTTDQRSLTLGAAWDSTPMAERVKDFLDNRGFKDVKANVPFWELESLSPGRTDQMSDTVKEVCRCGHYAGAHYAPLASDPRPCLVIMCGCQQWNPTPHPDPAGETPITNPSNTSNSLGDLPQTLEEEIPDWVEALLVEARGEVEALEDSMPGVTVASTYTALIHLAESRSRLLTALEEKENVIAMLTENMNTYVGQRDHYVDRCSALQSSSVLQKEELAKQYRRRMSFDEAMAQQILTAAVAHAKQESSSPNYVAPGGVQDVSLPRWVAESLLTQLDDDMQTRNPT